MSADDDESIPALAWRCLGLVRDADRLRHALTRTAATLERLSAAPPVSLAAAQVRSLATVAYLMALAAYRREESRGGHYRTDFPARDDERWLVHCADVRPDA